MKARLSHRQDPYIQTLSFYPSASQLSTTVYGSGNNDKVRVDDEVLHIFPDIVHILVVDYHVVHLSLEILGVFMVVDFWFLSLSVGCPSCLRLIIRPDSAYKQSSRVGEQHGHLDRRLVHSKDIARTELLVLDELSIGECILGAVRERLFRSSLLYQCFIIKHSGLQDCIFLFRFDRVCLDSSARKATKMMYGTFFVRDSMGSLLATFLAIECKRTLSFI